MTTQPQMMCAYLTVKGAQDAIDFYVKAFGATLDFKLIDPSDGRIGHAELELGPSRLFISDEYADFGAVSPDSLGGCPVKFHLDVADAESFVANAVEHGAMLLQPLRTEFFGERRALVADPFGYSWFIAQKVEDVSPEEMQIRWDASVIDVA